MLTLSAWLALGAEPSVRSKSVPPGPGIEVSLQSASSWSTRNVLTSLTSYKGRPALRVVGSAGDDIVDKLVMVPGTLRNGLIEADFAGMPEPDQPRDSRAYLGIAFRVSPDLSCFESIYVRPENSRAADQLRRNRSTQYIAFPDRPWQKLRNETPGKYESYVDLEPGVWTRLRVQIAGSTARLYINDAAQPALVVTDLVSGCATGSEIGLWIGNRTIAYFSNIKVTPL